MHYYYSNATIIQDFRYTYDDFRNLATRTEAKYATPMTETFKYDNLDRLDTVLFNNAVSEMVYDAYGRMRSRTSEGDVVFRSASYNDQSKPHAVRWAEVNGDAFPCAPQTIAYTMHDKVKSIQQGDDELTIDYGYDRQRIGMTQENDVLQTMSSKLYVGNCEFNHSEIRLQRFTYLSGPMGVFAVYEELGPLYKGGGEDADNDGAVGDSLTDSGYTGALYYLHRDHLGSITTITNASGAIVQELSYDAWGNLRNPTTWSGSFTGTPKFDRGYTGHEHLCTFGLINMNGRVYDPVMCCFLSVDTYVQDPGSPQNFNRYAYCLNNPLKYTDPDGEWVQYVIGGLLGAWNGYSIGKAAGLKGVDLFLSTICGAGAGVATAGIGTVVSDAFSNVALGTIMGGAASGAVSGGAFGTASAYASGKRGEDLANAFFKGFNGGLLGGAAGSAIGGYLGGGWGALAGGFTSSSVATAFQYDSFQDIQWGNVILNGIFGAALGLSVYHVATAYSYHESGLQSALSYKQYSKLIRITQRSMMTNREAKFVAYSDGSSISRLGSAHNVSSDDISYENAIFDYHTHPSPANTLADGEGFSTYESAKTVLGDGRKSDEYTRAVLTNEKKYDKPMYLGTREGHFWYMNSGGKGTRGMVNSFDHSSVFFYRQGLYMLYRY